MLLDLAPDDVDLPWWDWAPKLRMWLRERGYTMQAHSTVPPDGYSIEVRQVGHTTHAVVLLDGGLWHDPMPGGIPGRAMVYLTLHRAA